MSSAVNGAAPTISITLDVYSHAMPTMQCEAVHGLLLVRA